MVLKHKDVILSVLIKIALYVYAAYSNLEENVKAQPFFVTKFHDYERVKEAHYFIDRGLDPYTIEHVFQKPLLVYLLYYIRDMPFTRAFLYFVCDVVIGQVIQSTEFLHQRVKDPQVLDQSRRIFKFFYYFNPIMYCALITHWTSIFDMALGLLSVHLFISRKRFTTAAFTFALSLYLNPVNIMLLLAFLLAPEYTNSGISKGRVVFFCAQVVVFVALLIGVSFKITGSWLFLHECYIRAYHVNLYQPSVNFIWGLFSGMFNKYQLFYHAAIGIMPLCFIYPLKKIFGKGIKQHKWELQNGLFGFYVGVAWFLGYWYFSYVTIYEICVISILFFTGFEYVFRIKILVVFGYTAIFIGGLTSCLTALWFYGLTGNPNYNFFQITVMYIFVVAILTESLKEFARDRPTEVGNKEHEKAE